MTRSVKTDEVECGNTIWQDVNDLSRPCGPPSPEGEGNLLPCASHMPSPLGKVD